jgi:hypothetical protein
MHFSLLDRWRAAQVLQLSEEEVAKRLAILRQREYLVVRGRVRGPSYDLKRELADRLRGRAAVDAELSLDEEVVGLREDSGPPERMRPVHQCRDQAFLRFSFIASRYIVSSRVWKPGAWCGWRARAARPMSSCRRSPE